MYAKSHVYLNIMQKIGLVDFFETCICDCIDKETLKCYITRLGDKSTG